MEAVSPEFLSVQTEDDADAGENQVLCEVRFLVLPLREATLSLSDSKPSTLNLPLFIADCIIGMNWSDNDCNLATSTRQCGAPESRRAAAKKRPRKAGAKPKGKTATRKASKAIK